MKNWVRLLVASCIIAFLVFAFVFWILKWEYHDAIILGAVALVVGLAGEAARFFLIKQEKNRNKNI